MRAKGVKMVVDGTTKGNETDIPKPNVHLVQHRPVSGPVKMRAANKSCVLPSLRDWDLVRSKLRFRSTLSGRLLR